MEHTIYLVFAVIGCTLLVAQVLLQVFGLADADDVGMDVDVDGGDFDGDPAHGADGHGNLFFGVLSFKALTAFAGVFGLTGRVWDTMNGGRSSTAGFLQNLASSLPPMMHMMKDIGGVEMPEYFARMIREEAAKQAKQPVAEAESDSSGEETNGDAKS